MLSPFYCLYVPPTEIFCYNKIISGIIALLGTIVSLPFRRKEDTDARSDEKENEE